MSSATTTVTSVERDITTSPEGWVVTRLGEACEINPPKPAGDALPATAPITFVPMPAVSAIEGAITEPRTKAFAEVRKGFTSFRNNDVLMAKITPCMENGKAAITRNLTNGMGFGSTEFHVLRPTGAILPEYVYSFIRQESYRRAAESEMTGSVGQKRVPQSFLDLSEFPLPPLAEQVRIVKKLTELVNAVKACRQRLSKVSLILKRFRQAVLSAACSGRLTEDWRESHASQESVEQLLERILTERKSAWGRGQYREPAEVEPDELHAIPNHWRCASFDTFVSDSFYGPRFSEDDYCSEGVPTIRTTDIGFDGRVALHDPPRIRLTSKEQRDLTLRHEDLLVTRTGATIGKCALYEERMGPAIPSAYLIRFRLTRQAIPARYLLIFLMSPLGQQLLLGGSTAVAQPNVNAKNICRFCVPLPPKGEIAEVIHRVDVLLKTASAVEQRLLTAVATTDKLTQSILAKAFRGELVPTEAELARREGREYEPAAVLLERIRAERANQIKTPLEAKRKLRKANAHV